MPKRRFKKPPYPPSLLKLPVNDKGTDWFAGDLHGETKLLRRALKAVDFDPAKDRLISAGDIVDRGPDSDGMLRLFRKSPAWFFSALGNHDAMMREACIYRAGNVFRTWHHNGGHWAMSKPEARWKRLAQPLMRMPLGIEVPMADGTTIGVIHAELPDDVLWEDIARMQPDSESAVDTSARDANYLLWARGRIRCALTVLKSEGLAKESLLTRYAVVEGLQAAPQVNLLIMGHTRLTPPVPLRISNYLWLDTGAGYVGGWLTLANPLSGECVQVAHAKRVRRIPIPGPLSLEGWHLSDNEMADASAELKAKEERSRELLRTLGYGPW